MAAVVVELPVPCPVPELAPFPVTVSDQGSHICPGFMYWSSQHFLVDLIYRIIITHTLAISIRPSHTIGNHSPFNTVSGYGAIMIGPV